MQRHLSDLEFEAIFQMSRTDFYRVPMWKRNDLKKRFKLFWTPPQSCALDKENVLL